jgi:hypothetical protein
MTRSYSDLSDSATTFDPEEQFDRDIDERMKGMTKEEAVAQAVCDLPGDPSSLDIARAAIAAAGKWDAEQGKGNQTPMYRLAMAQSQVSAGLDSAIQDELDHPPASIMEEGK